MRYDVKSTESGGTMGALIEKLAKLKPLHAALGKRTEIELREHFLQRGGESFWPEIRSSTAYTGADEDAGHVAISDVRFNQKVYGGDITPKEAKFLTIPAIAEAKGKPASVFDFLKVVRFKGSGALALVEADRTFIKIGKQRKDGSRGVKDKGRSQRGKVWYWLARKVRQKKDAKALPTKEHMAAALVDETEEFFARR